MVGNFFGMEMKKKTSFLGQNVVSGVVHWMVVRLGLTQQHNVLVQPKQTMIKEEMYKGSSQAQEGARKKSVKKLMKYPII